MTEITIATGETEQLAKAASPGQNYQVRVENADIRVSDVKNYASQGVRIDAGLDALIRAPAETPLYAHSPSGSATIEINQGATNGLTSSEHPEIRHFPSGSVGISGSVDSHIQSWGAGTLAVEQQTPIEIEDSGGNQIDPATDSTLANTLAREISDWTAGTLAVDITEWNGGELPVSLGGNNSGMVHGQEVIATAGTAEALNGGNSQTVPDGSEIAIKALADNAGKVYIGDSAVTESNGAELGPGQGISLSLTDVASVYVNGSNSGDGVSWITEV